MVRAVPYGMPPGASTSPPSLDRLTGVLLGTALGDALGLPFEGLSARTLARRAPTLDRYHLIGTLGVVSDDTQHAALLVASLLAGQGDLERSRHAFRRALGAWVLSLPWGIGMATLKACGLILLGVERSGRDSAGNGAAMRGAAPAVAAPCDRERRLALGRMAAEVTHTDVRAIEGALFVGELAAACLAHAGPAAGGTAADGCTIRRALVHDALTVVTASDLRIAIEGAALGTRPDTAPATGFVVDSVATAVSAFVALGDDVLAALGACIRRGGDTDSNAAILGGWLGAWHGADALPATLVARLQPGPYGEAHLRALAAAAHAGAAPPSTPYVRAALWTWLLYPVIIGHGFYRLVPH